MFEEKLDFETFIKYFERIVDLIIGLLARFNTSTTPDPVDPNAPEEIV